ncbi:MAG TPA: hypothetical protein VGB76_15930 [Pyrinomonadaceae bacterium]
MRRILSVLLCCWLLQFAGGTIASGQQIPVAPLAEDASLAETLKWLESQLVRHGKMRYYDPFGPFEHKYYDTRFEYLRADGCVVRYRRSTMRRGDEYSVNLSDLDPAQVKAEVPKNWKGGRVIFSSATSSPAVTYHAKGGKARSHPTGEFASNDKAALEGIAGALRRAIASCRR